MKCFNCKGKTKYNKNTDMYNCIICGWRELPCTDKNCSYCNNPRLRIYDEIVLQLMSALKAVEQKQYNKAIMCINGIRTLTRRSEISALKKIDQFCSMCVVALKFKNIKCHDVLEDAINTMNNIIIHERGV